MDIWPKYKSPLGYLAGDSKIDTYGVDHSKFSLRDEIAYQMARSEREGQLIKNLNSQGINKDYPQYGTNFWGGNAENNYGFGSSDISENIENVTNSLKNKNFGFDQNTSTIAIVPQQKQIFAQPNTMAIVQNNALGQQNNALGQQNQNAENITKLYSIPSLQNNSALKPLDNTNSYTTESAWSYPNKTSAPFYEKITKSIDNNAPNTTQKIDYSLYGNDFSKEYIDRMLNDNRFQQAVKRTKLIEGGYDNNENDRGGETNYGISTKFYPNEDIKNMTPERACAIFYRDYWIKHKINQLPDELADIVFDNGIVQGQKTSIRHLQRALGVKADGIIGSDTLNAINYANYSTIKQEFINNVKSRIKAIVTKNPSQETFKNGWINRSNTY